MSRDGEAVTSITIATNSKTNVKCYLYIYTISHDPASFLWGPWTAHGPELALRTLQLSCTVTYSVNLESAIQFTRKQSAQTPLQGSIETDEPLPI